MKTEPAQRTVCKKVKKKKVSSVFLMFLISVPRVQMNTDLEERKSPVHQIFLNFRYDI